VINADLELTWAGLANEELLPRSHLRRSSARVQDHLGLARWLWSIMARVDAEIDKLEQLAATDVTAVNRLALGREVEAASGG
jgi:hypothetical protein